MAIDNPIDAFEQYMQDEPELPKALAKILAKLGFPDGGAGLDILLDVSDRLFNSVSADERVKALWELFKNEFKNLETTKASREDVARAVALTFWYDRQQRDDAKLKRIVKLIGNAVRSDEQIQDVTSFVQMLEQLNERDIIVLKVVNKTMNRVGDWKPPAMSNDVGKVHPNVFIQRAAELSVQIAIALGQATETNLYTREEGYAVCNRLQGFGLVHDIEMQARELPLTNIVSACPRKA